MYFRFRTSRGICQHQRKATNDVDHACIASEVGSAQNAAASFQQFAEHDKGSLFPLQS